MKKVLVVLALAVFPVACSSGGTSELLRGTPRSNHAVGDGTSSDTSPTEDTTIPETDAAADMTDSGSIGDAGADGADASDGSATDAGPPNAFTGAAAFVAKTGPSTIKGAHPNNGNPAKLDCLTSNCHGAGGGGPRFTVGGTVFTSAAATTPAAQVEVRFRDAAGDAVSAYTDANGNFFVRAADAVNLTFPLKTGARNAATTHLMVASIANGACNSAGCHGAAATGFIHVP